MIYEDLFDGPSFFDSAEERRTKEIARASMTEEKIAEMEAMKEAMANIPEPPPPEEDEEIVEPAREDPPRNLVSDFFDSNISYEEFEETLSDEEIIEFEETMEQMNNLPVEETLLGHWDENGNYFDRCEEHAEQKTVNNIPRRMLPSNVLPRVNNSKLVGTTGVVIGGCEEFSIGSYAYESGCLYHMTKAGHGTLVANFFVRIKAEVITVIEDINEQNCVIDSRESTSWIIEIFCQGEIFTAEITMAALRNEKEMLKITRDRGFIEPTKAAKDHYLKFLNDVVCFRKCEKVYKYNATGWMKTQNGQWIYLTDKGVIGHPEMELKAEVPYKFTYSPEKVGSKEIFEEFYGLRNLCPNKPEHSVFLMHYLVLSVMTTIFQEAAHGVNFIVALIGPTNSQKTSSAIVFTRIFDRSSKAVADIRFNSTEVAIMEKMESYGDAILLVDDFLPCDSKGAMKNQMNKSELLIRSYGDRVPRKRSKSYAQINNIKEYSRVKGCCVMTGEVFDTTTESSMTRVMQLPFECGDVDLELLSFYQRNMLNVPTFIYDFICFAEANMDRIFEIIKLEVDTTRRDKKLGIRIPRFKDTLGIMRAELDIFYSYVKSKSFMSDEQISSAMEYDEALIRKLIQANDGDTKTKSPAAVICTALQRAIVTNKLCVVTEKESENMRDFDKVVIENEKYFMILSETLQNVYATYCRETNREVIYSSGREMANPLRKEDAILRKEENGSIRSTHKITGKTDQRFLHIKKTKFAEFCNILNEF